MADRVKQGFALRDRTRNEYAKLIQWEDDAGHSYEIEWCDRIYLATIHKNPARLKREARRFVVTGNFRLRELELLEMEGDDWKVREVIVTPPELY